MKNVKFLQLLSAGTDIVSVVNSVDNIEGSMKKLVDNKMINKIEKLLQEARTHVTVEDIDLHENEEKILWAVINFW